MFGATAEIDGAAGKSTTGLRTKSETTKDVEKENSSGSEVREMWPRECLASIHVVFSPAEFRFSWPVHLRVLAMQTTCPAELR